MSFQELDFEDFPVSRAELIAEYNRLKAQREAEAAEDIVERRRERRHHYRRVDVSVDTQTLDVEEFPLQPANAPPPRALVNIGRKVGFWERKLGTISTGIRAQADELRFVEIDMGTGQTVKVHRRATVQGGPKIDVSLDLQTLDIENLPVSRPDIETPQSIRNITGLTLRAGAGFYDALTMPVRPTLIAETVKTGTGVIFSHKIRKEVGKAIKSDPAGFAAELVGGYAGGRLLGYGIGKARGRYSKGEIKRLGLDLPDEAFYSPDELKGMFPEEIVTEQPVFRGYEEIVDTTSNAKFGMIDDSGKWGIADDFKPYSPAKGTFRNRPWETGGRSVLMTPEGKIFFKPLTHTLEGIDFRPGIRISTGYPNVTGMGSGIGFEGLGALAALSRSHRTKGKTTPFVFTGTGIENVQGLGPDLDQLSNLGQTISPIVVIGPDPKPHPPPVPPIEKIDKPPKYRPPSVTPVQHQQWKQKPIPVQRQRTQQRQKLDSPPIIPPAILAIMRAPTRRRKRYVPPEIKKKKKRNDAYAALFAGEYRSYGIDIKKLRRLI